jgi:hypothetical protein
MRLPLQTLAFLSGVCLLAGCPRADSVDDDPDDTGGGEEEPVPPTSVLFIGNSFTFWNDGLETHVEALRSGTGDRTFETEEETEGGASLEVMWDETNARSRIEQGGFDVVVLQEDIPETSVESFHTYARLFDGAIRESGARPVFFMAWDYDRLDWISMDEIADAHWAIADELDIEVAPVGTAWKRAAEERPSLDMYGGDDEHPSIHGTYLAATTIYSVLFQESPVGLTYTPAQEGGVSEDEAAFLQGVAWDEVQAPR